jgi:hypothetical protein
VVAVSSPTRPPVAICVVTIAFGCGAAARVVFFAGAGFFGGTFAAGLLRAPVLRLRAFPPAGDLRAVRTSFVFLPAPCFRAFVGFLRFAACLRFLAMGNSYFNHRRSKDIDGRVLTRDDGLPRLLPGR